MRNDKIQISEWGVDEHPSTELLRQYDEGVLPAALRHELERHLLDCELCEDVLGGMALSDRNRTRQARERIWQRVRTRLRKGRRRAPALHGLGDWRVALGVLMMFCSLGLLLFYHYTRSRSEQKAAQFPAEVLPPSPEELLARTIDSALVLEIPAPPPAPVHQLPASKTVRPTAQQAEQLLTGRLLSPAGQGIAGASIRVQGNNRQTSTDAAGNFSLLLPAKQQLLLITADGFKPQQITVLPDSSPLSLTAEPVHQ